MNVTILQYSMSIIEKVFKYEATELPVIKYKDEIWFKAVVVATILKYTNQRKAIRDHQIKAVTSCSTHKIDQQETDG